MTGSMDFRPAASAITKLAYRSAHGTHKTTEICRQCTWTIPCKELSQVWKDLESLISAFTGVGFRLEFVDCRLQFSSYTVFNSHEEQEDLMLGLPQVVIPPIVTTLLRGNHFHFLPSTAPNSPRKCGVYELFAVQIAGTFRDMATW